MSMDYSETTKFLKQFEGAVQEYDVFLRQFLTEMGLRCLAQTKQLTPRDIGAGGGLVSKWELSDVYGFGGNLFIIIFNPQEYASFVEDGHRQSKRFLPIKYLEDSPNGKRTAAAIRAKYGEKAEGVMLKDKWIPGYHMARISINKIEKEIPKRYEQQLRKFLKDWGVAE